MAQSRFAASAANFYVDLVSGRALALQLDVEHVHFVFAGVFHRMRLRISPHALARFRFHISRFPVFKRELHRRVRERINHVIRM